MPASGLRAVALVKGIREVPGCEGAQGMMRKGRKRCAIGMREWSEVVSARERRQPKGDMILKLSQRD